MVGNGSITEELLNQELDLAGITKENLKITSIMLTGIDQPKVLVDVIKKISEKNKNIVHIEQKNESDQFCIRILVENMRKKEEEELSSYLDRDTRFSKHIVV